MSRHCYARSGVCAMLLLAAANLVTAQDEASSPAVEVFRDPHFRDGFTVLAPATGKKVPVGCLQPPGCTGEPSWQLAQWSSKHDIAGTAPQVLESGSILFSNAGKRVVLGLPGSDEADLTLAVNASAEYGDRARQKPEPWPHLLASQDIRPDLQITGLESLTFRVEARLLKSELHETEGYDSRIHAAQFIAFITVQNRNRQSPGYGDFLWFGIPVYDNRFRIPRKFMAPDQAHKKFIFTPPGEAYTTQSVHDREWVTFDADLLPLMKEGLEAAWERGHLPQSRDIADFRLGGFSIGWEVPGTFDVAVQIRDLGLSAVAIATE